MTLQFHTPQRFIALFLKSQPFSRNCSFYDQLLSCEVIFITRKLFYGRSDFICDARKHQWGEVAFIRPLKPKFHVARRILIARFIRVSPRRQRGSRLRNCRFEHVSPIDNHQMTAINRRLLVRALKM